MKKQYIEKAIRHKVKDWLESITDRRLRERLQHSVIVTGGCITSMLLGEKVRDYDLYFQSLDDTLALTQYYLRKFTEEQEDTPPTVKVLAHREACRVEVRVEGQGTLKSTAYKSKDAGYHPLYFTTNSVSLSGAVQLITRFTGPPAAIHKNFDFAHCKNYWTFQEGLVLNQTALEATLSRSLIYQGSLYPLCSIFRTRKFLKRGWNIDLGQYLKMAMQICDLDLHNPGVLADQCTGCDLTYFSNLIERIDRDVATEVSTSKVIKLVEEVFEHSVQEEDDSDM